MSDSEMIECIRKGEHAGALDQLYQNFPAFKNSLQKSGGRSSDAADLFQDALVILLEKITDESFTLSCSINSFLFGICRNLSLEYYRKKGKEINLQLQTPESSYESDELEALVEQEQKYLALDKILVQIGKRCMELLSLFYYQSMSMTAIAGKLGFKSETSAKTQKYKCIEKARNLTETVMLEIKTELS